MVKTCLAAYDLRVMKGHGADTRPCGECRFCLGWQSVCLPVRPAVSLDLLTAYGGLCIVYFTVY